VKTTEIVYSVTNRSPLPVSGGVVS